MKIVASSEVTPSKLVEYSPEFRDELRLLPKLLEQAAKLAAVLSCEGSVNFFPTAHNTNIY
jgi:hypothetical protein